MRQVVLDTETTGLEPAQGHRIIEIGAVELVDRKPTGRHFHKYINPQRDVDDGAFEVHGLSREFLADKPVFASVCDEFLAFVEGAELIIHNAGFDVSFIDYELSLLDRPPRTIERLCEVTDSLALARNRHPGQKNDLDALCRRYRVDNSSRTLHGALLDAEILADVYLLMTGGQTALFGSADDPIDDTGDGVSYGIGNLAERPALMVISPSVEELAAHEALLDFLESSGSAPLWRGQDANAGLEQV